MKKIYFLISFILLTVGGVMAQNNTVIINKAFDKVSNDSSYIAVNMRGGWQSVISHLTPLKTDSVLLELVVKNNNVSLDITKEQLVGVIKMINLKPKKLQTVQFRIMRAVFRIRVESDGKCYLRLLTGSLPKSSQLIIPVRAKYKLN